MNRKTQVNEHPVKYHESPPLIIDSAVESAGGEKSSAKALKKAAAKAEKEAKKAAREQAALEKQNAADSLRNKMVEDIEKDIFGHLPPITSTYRTKREWTGIRDITREKAGQHVWVRARLHSSRCKGSLGFVVLRNQLWTIQGILDSGKGENITKDCIKWTGSLALESVVDVYGQVVAPDIEILGTSQKTELHIERIYCVSEAAPGEHQMFFLSH